MDDLWNQLTERLLQCPDDIAILAPTSSIPEFRRAQLYNLAVAFASVLHTSYQCSPSNGAAVAVYLSNSPLFLVAALASLSVGSPFVPLDPRWPPARLNHVLDSVKPQCVIWAEHTQPGGHGKPTLAPRDEINRGRQLPLMRIDLETLAASAQNPEYMPAAKSTRVTMANTTDANRSDIAYVMFTSGSTGSPSPLGAQGTASGILQRCHWMQSTYPLQRGRDLVAFKTSPGFVDGIWEIFGPLLAGVPMLVVPLDLAANTLGTLRLLGEHEVTHFTAIPSVWEALVRCIDELPSYRDGLRCLRQAVASGEPLTLRVLADMQRVLPRYCRVLNLYGSTETAADATCFDCTRFLIDANASRTADHRGRSLVPVGRPISGMFVGLAALSSHDHEARYHPHEAPVRDVHLLALKPPRETSPAHQEEGEVVLGGFGLSHGYLNAPKETQQRFVHVQTDIVRQRCVYDGATETLYFAQLGERATDDGGGGGGTGVVRLFRTGDKGILNADGELVITGRLDLQIKIDGIRVDLIEVEEVLSRHPAVHAAAATGLYAPNGRPVLIAFVQLEGRDAVITYGDPGNVQNVLLQWCEKILPAPSVPKQVILLEALPRGSAGKLDRSALQRILLDHRATLDRSTLAQGKERTKTLTAAAPQVSTQTLPSHPRNPQPLAITAASRVAAQTLPPHNPTNLATHPAAAATPSTRLSESAVHNAFAAALGHAAFEPTDNLFLIGGNSLNAAEIAGRLSIDVSTMLSNPSVRSLTTALSQRSFASTPESMEALAGRDKDDTLPRGTFDLRSWSDSPPPPASMSGAGIACVPSVVLRASWRAKLLLCVDAAPLQHEDKVYACSHGGDVVCLNAAGQRVWSTLLPHNSQADVGLVVCRDVCGLEHLAVATNEGLLCFFDAINGTATGVKDLGHAQRAAPAVDPWHGYVWLAGHGQNLTIVAPPPLLGRQHEFPLPGAVSANITFVNTPVDGKHVALIACLNGTLLALTVYFGKTKRKRGSGGDTDGEGVVAEHNESVSVCVEEAWRCRLDEPFFASPCVIAPKNANRTTANQSSAVLNQSVVVATTVKGRLTAFDVADGAILWQADLREQIPSRSSTVGIFSTPVLSSASSSEGFLHLLVVSRCGRLFTVDARDGRCLCAQQLTQSAITSFTSLSARDQAGEEHRRHLFATTTSEGQVMLLQAVESEGGGSCRKNRPLVVVVDGLRLPAPTFASAAWHAIGEHGVVIGCRDEHVYCLTIQAY